MENGANPLSELPLQTFQDIPTPKADAQQIVVVPRHHAVGGIEGVLVRVIRALFVLAQHHAMSLGCQRLTETQGSNRGTVKPGHSIRSYEAHSQLDST